MLRNNVDARRCSYFELGLPVVFEVGFWPILYFFSAIHQRDTWTSCPPEYTWYGVILWVLGVLGQGLKSECADIFHQSFIGLLRHTDKRQKGQNSSLWLQSRSVLSSFGDLLMSCTVTFHVVRSALQYSACRI